MATTHSSDDDCKQLHVAVFPWLAFGHIIPFLEVSKYIAQKGHKVSFLSTTRNIQRLSSHLPPLINLVKLTLPRVQELPENAESTMDVCTGDVRYLKRAFDGLQPEVTRFLEEESPDWIIYDFAPYWLPSVAAGLGISRAFFSIFTAWLIACMGQSSDRMIKGSDVRKTVEDFMTPRKWIPFPNKLCYRKHEANWMMSNNSVKASDEVSDAYRLGKVLKGSDCMLIRYCYEFEPQWLTLLEKLHQLPVVPLGLMPPETPTNVGDEKDDTWPTIKKWLDGQPKGQVVYVALGSEFMVTKSQLVELALGLELSGLPFFWALRKSAGSTNPDSMELPEGFLERTRALGVVWTSWVPQLQILSHESVGGFLTHCGWSSIVEGLMFGHPLIMLPISGEQALNSRVLGDKQVGIEILRNEEDGFFTKESVATTARSVLANDEGNICKANGMELSQVFGDTKLQKKYIEDFIDYIEKKRCMAVA